MKERIAQEEKLLHRMDGSATEGGECMNLKNNRITVGELLDNPDSKAVFQRRFGKWMKHPMVNASRTLTLEQLIGIAEVWMPQKMIRETLEELKKL